VIYRIEERRSSGVYKMRRYVASPSVGSWCAWPSTAMKWNSKLEAETYAMTLAMKEPEYLGKLRVTWTMGYRRNF